MVTSIAIPRATLKTNTVEGFSEMPNHPIIPAVINKGTKLGINEHISMGKDRNKKIIHKAINKNAQNIDSPNPFTIKLLPSKNVTLLPVITILYLLESKITLVALSTFFKKTGNAALPMSFIFTLTLVNCLSLSKNLFNICVGLFFACASAFVVFVFK